jgi:ligand-binding sensor domain-containing protein/signal transduction histidine kinase
VDDRNRKATHYVWLLSCLLICLLLAAGLVRAEHLPIRTYTTADGLAEDNVTRIVRDSRGFLWFCTGEGLSRFDGYQFTNYTTEQGLPHRAVNDLLETSDGNYWVATGGGLSHFNPVSSVLFTTYHPGADELSWHVEALIQDRQGFIWCGTHKGVYRLEASGDRVQFQFVDMGMPGEAEGDLVQALVSDRQGALWVATRGSGIYRRWPDGRIEHYATQQGLPSNRVEALLEDREGRLWIATTNGLAQLVAVPDPTRSVIARVYTTRDGLVSNWIESLFQSAGGALWLSTDNGVSEFLASTGDTGRAFRNYTTANGLSSQYILGFAEDRDGNLWLGTDSGGAMKFARSGFTNYTETDGLAAAGVDSILENRAGELCVISSGTKHFVGRFDGKRFVSVWPNFPKQISNFGWGSNQVAFQDHTGEWWMPTGQGLVRFPAVARVEQLAHTNPKAVYTTQQGLPFDNVFRLFEDSHGDIWISTLSLSANGLSRWRRATEKLENFSEADGLSLLKTSPPDAFAEDAAGNLWIGHWGGGLTRYDAAGRFTVFGESNGLPAGTIRSLFLDHAHRLWIASALGGLARLDDSVSKVPRFITYSTAQGLSSNDLWCITEDGSSRIYIGTGRGLDRLDPETGHIEHYTDADGLLHGKVTTAFRDSHGTLWFGSNVHGLSRFAPGPDVPHTPPPIMISGLHIAGVAYPISQLGETAISEVDLGANQNQLNIDFVGLSFGSGEILRYQYELEGADRNWSPPGEQRSVNYANLASGRYRFLVRAVNAEGLTSVAPATLVFTVAPPVWRRGWFLALIAISVGLAVYSLHRQRVARLVELERVRTRIATDLHDDIGANLSLIAMLSEVARGFLKRDDPRLREWFSTIATTSRDTVDAMSDIVWAVNPRRDHLSDLTQRMRRFADDILGARDIALNFHAPELERDLKVGADLRREVFLIFKETINNTVRHSQGTIANIELEVARGWLVLRVTDNGRGFDLKNTREGNGLASIRLRAGRLGGTVDVSSPNGPGTSVTLRVPLDHRARF